MQFPQVIKSQNKQYRDIVLSVHRSIANQLYLSDTSLRNWIIREAMCKMNRAWTQFIEPVSDYQEK